MRCLARAAVAVAVAASAASAATPVAASAASTQAGPVAVRYRAPVAAPVTDWFRPPATPYGAGNLGIDYATAPGTPVGAAAGGQVVFAGPVGLGLHVVVLHADGVRTSSSFLASVAVRRGQRVAPGQTLGTTGLRLHFGARAGDAYLDPLVLLQGGAGPLVVRLVPDDGRTMGSEAAERSALRRVAGAVSGAVVGINLAALGWARDGVVAVGQGVAFVGANAQAAAVELQQWIDAVVPSPPLSFGHLATGVGEWWSRRLTCTPPGVVPPRPSGRRRVVLVAGLGSTSSPNAGVDGVDTGALGYAPGDIHRFSYRGGTTAEAAYSAADTQVDIAVSGRRLRDLLDRLVAAEHGVPIDVIAHSQGGLVARIALGATAPTDVEHLITLATPHRGADLATALALSSRASKGAAAQNGVALLGVSGIDPTSTSVRQLSETSDFLRALNARPLPDGVRVTSIAGRADVVVPVPRAHLPGATNAVVTVDGLNEHPLVPGDGAATREMALALAGMTPTCEGLADAVADVVVGDTIAAGEDALGLLMWGLAA